MGRMTADMHVGRPEQAHRQGRDDRQQRNDGQRADDHLQHVEAPGVHIGSPAFARPAGKQPGRHDAEYGPVERAEAEAQQQPVTRLQRGQADAPENHGEQHEHREFGPVQHGRSELRSLRRQQPAIPGRRHRQVDVACRCAEIDIGRHGPQPHAAIRTPVDEHAVFARQNRQHDRPVFGTQRLLAAVDGNARHLGTRRQPHRMLGAARAAILQAQ